jgi:hypothetical protein
MTADHRQPISPLEDSLPTGSKVPGGYVDAAGYVHAIGCECLSEGHCSIELDLYYERLAAEEIRDQAASETLKAGHPDLL